MAALVWLLLCIGFPSFVQTVKNLEWIKISFHLKHTLPFGIMAWDLVVLILIFLLLFFCMLLNSFNKKKKERKKDSKYCMYPCGNKPVSLFNK